MTKQCSKWLGGLVALMLVLAALAGASSSFRAAAAQEITPTAGNAFGDGDGSEPDGEMIPYWHGNCDGNQHKPGCDFDLTVEKGAVGFVFGFVLEYDGHVAEDCVLVMALEGTYKGIHLKDGGAVKYDLSRYDLGALADFRAAVEENGAGNCPHRTIDDIPVLGKDSDLDRGFKGDTTAGNATEEEDLGA